MLCICRTLCADIAKAVGHLHRHNFIHGDLKPQNILRIRDSIVLIDLDAAVSFDPEYYLWKAMQKSSAMEGGQVVVNKSGFVGLKFSSGYLPPEMVFVDDKDGSVCVKSPTDDLFANRCACVQAGPAHDMWSLGVVFYAIFTNSTLFLEDGDGNIRPKDLLELARWSEASLLDKLFLQDRVARNMLSLLLCRDPAQRPKSVDHLLAHPFFTGQSEGFRFAG